MSKLEEVYALCRAGEIDDALDILFELMDEMLMAADVEGIDTFLKSVDVERLDTNLIVGVLVVSLPAAVMPSRVALLQKCEERLQRIDPLRIEGLLRGLRENPWSTLPKSSK